MTEPFSSNANNPVQWWACLKDGAKEPGTDSELPMLNKPTAARNTGAIFPENNGTKLQITQVAHSLNVVYDALRIIRAEMNHLAT